VNNALISIIHTAHPTPSNCLVEWAGYNPCDSLFPPPFLFALYFTVKCIKIFHLIFIFSTFPVGLPSFYLLSLARQVFVDTYEELANKNFNCSVKNKRFVSFLFKFYFHLVLQSRSEPN
jgi:hypothetical protein